MVGVNRKNYCKGISEETFINIVLVPELAEEGQCVFEEEVLQVE